MAKAKRETRPYPDNLLCDIRFGEITITGKMSENFTERFEEIVLSVAGKERFNCVRSCYCDCMTYRETGELYNITPSRVRNLIDTTLRRLRHPRIVRNIRDILQQEFDENPELRIIKKQKTVPPVVAEEIRAMKTDSSYSEFVEMQKLKECLESLSPSERCHAMADFMKLLEEKYHV